MENPFDRPPINVSANLVDGRVPNWRKDYLAIVPATTDEKGRLLDSLRTGEDPTIRDGVNLALSRLLDSEAPKDSLGKTSFLVHDGTGTGKSYQAILAAKAIALETGEPALVTTRGDLIPAQGSLSSRSNSSERFSKRHKDRSNSFRSLLSMKLRIAAFRKFANS